VAGLTVGLLAAVAVGVVLVLVLVLRAVSQSQAEIDGVDTSGTLAVRLRGSLFTGNARPTFDAILAAVAAAEPKPATVELDCRAVTRATVPFLDGLHQLSRDLTAERVELRLVGMRPDVHAVSSTEAWFASVDHARSE
jgi:SulP family sulfate permease